MVGTAQGRLCPPYRFELERAICDKFDTTGKSILIFRISVKPLNKNIPLHNSGNQNYNLACLAPTRGAYHDRHDTWGAGCDGRFGVRRFFTPDENAKAYGEVVWSWRRDAGVKFLRSTLLRDDGDNKPAPPGRARSKP